MSVLVDAARWPWRGRRWAHLVSDESLGELHEFARRLGKRRLSFQGDHYDVDEIDRDRALAMGAVAVDSRDVIRRLRGAGLRHRGAPPAWARLDSPRGRSAVAGVVDALGRRGGGVRLAAALDGLDLEGATALLAPAGPADPRSSTVEVAAFHTETAIMVLIEVPAGVGPPRIADSAADGGGIEVVVGERRPDGTLSVELFVDR